MGGDVDDLSAVVDLLYSVEQIIKGGGNGDSEEKGETELYSSSSQMFLLNEQTSAAATHVQVYGGTISMEMSGSPGMTYLLFFKFNPIYVVVLMFTRIKLLLGTNGHQQTHER